MKNKGDFIFILFVVGVVLISLRDKIFKKKQDTNTPSSSIDTIPSAPKPINTENLGLKLPDQKNITEEEHNAIIRELGGIGKTAKLGDIVKTDKGTYQLQIIVVGGVVGTKVDWVLMSK